jgi:5-methylcytosine-specific restriction endonuclease McrA
VTKNDGLRYSVNDVASFARQASMSTSYKPALLKALTHLVRRGVGTDVPLLLIGSEFVSLYWVQAVVFRLRQAATVISEPEVVRHIRSAANLNAVRSVADLKGDMRERLDREMARILKINVLTAFHRSKPPDMAPLFEWQAGAASIRIPPAALDFINANAHALESLANLRWARYLEKCNLLAPLIIEKVKRNGAERGSLSRYLKILRQVDESSCFYCERPLSGTLVTHVDHVIPWSFLLADPLWDLVLACAPCNLAKSDELPNRTFIEKLTLANSRRSIQTLPPGFASAFIPRDELERYYEAALSVEWPNGWTPSTVLGAY